MLGLNPASSNKTNICLSKDRESSSPKLKRKKANKTNIVPIDALKTSKYNTNCTAKTINSTSRQQVVKGRGYPSATPAVPQLRERTESFKQKSLESAF